MPDTEEQRLDIIENCNHLLDGFLSEFNQTDNTPQGRMITQCKWFKERAENYDLPLPVPRGKLGSLLYIYTNGEMFNIDLTIKDKIMAEYTVECIELYMERLISIVDEAQLLLKPPYYPYAIRCIDALVQLLETSSRPLDHYEQGFIAELNQLKQLLEEDKIVPPLGTYMPKYPNFIKAKRSIRDLSNGKDYFFTVSDLIFDGVRPETWLTIEDAERETQNL